MRTFQLSASMSVNGAVTGGYSTQGGYFFSGSLNGTAQATFGSCGGDCDGVNICASVIPPDFDGIKVCKDVGLDVDFSSSNGLSLSIDL